MGPKDQDLHRAPHVRQAHYLCEARAAPAVEVEGPAARWRKPKLDETGLSFSVRVPLDEAREQLADALAEAETLGLTFVPEEATP